MLIWTVLPFLGIIIGTLSGLLGIGGGVILVPMLVMILPFLGVDHNIAIHLALGSSLATSCLTLLSSLLVHNRNGVLDQNIFYKFLPGIILGAITGPYIVHLLPAQTLRIIIGLLMLGLAINMAFDYKIPAHRRLPATNRIIASGLFFGLISSFAGLSGAALIVPYLIWFGISMRKAVGIAASCGLPLSLIGMTTYMIVGYGLTNLPYGAVGYVYWPAVVFIAVTSVPMAQVAARLSARVPKVVLKRLLAIIFALVASRMLFLHA